MKSEQELTENENPFNAEKKTIFGCSFVVMFYSTVMVIRD